MNPRAGESSKSVPYFQRLKKKVLYLSMMPVASINYNKSYITYHLYWYFMRINGGSVDPYAGHQCHYAQ